MKTNRFELTAVLAAMVLLSGCGSSDDEVLASVGDVRLTRRDVLRDDAIMVRLMTIANLPSDINHGAFRHQAIKTFVEREILVREAVRRQVGLTDEEFGRHQAKFVAEIPGSHPQTMAAFVSGLGKLSATFLGNLRKDALAEKMTNLLKDQFSAEASISARFATNAWKSVRAGNDFAVVGKKLLEMRKDVEFCENCAAPVGNTDGWKGDVSPLTKTCEGLTTWKVIREDDGKSRCLKITFKISGSEKAFDVWMAQQKQSADVRQSR